MGKRDDYIRASFSAFFDFLSKLEYLVSISFITKEQLEYFKYYIDRAAENRAARNFVRHYKFPLKGGLHKELDASKTAD